MDEETDKQQLEKYYRENIANKQGTFWIAGSSNPEYLVFFEKSKLNSLFRNTFGMSSYYRKISKEFQKKKINIVEIESFSCYEELYQCTIYDENFNKQDPKEKKVLYDGLKYPRFGVLYVLFDTYNFENQKNINYYSVDRYSFQMKAYVHDFLIFLSQSFGAKTIKWSYSIDKTSQESAKMSVSTSHEGIAADTGSGGENSTENKSSTDLVLTYDNNGSEIFFETTNNELPWCIKIQKIIGDSNIPYDLVKHWRNETIIKKFLENNKFFRYEFYIENDLLVDFVRKRQNGMNEVHHEMVFYDKHRSMFNYYNDIGSKYLTSMGLSYSSEHSTSQQTTTFYHVEFYDTNELEKITLSRCIIEDKTILQMKRENEHTIHKIREMQSKWEETHPEARDYKYQYHDRLFELKVPGEKGSQSKRELEREELPDFDLSSTPGMLFKSRRRKWFNFKSIKSCCRNRDISREVYNWYDIETDFYDNIDMMSKTKKNEDEYAELINVFEDPEKHRSAESEYNKIVNKKILQINENEIKLIQKKQDEYYNVLVILQRYKKYFDMLDTDFAEYKKKQQVLANEPNSQMIRDDLAQKKKDHDNLMEKKKYEFIRRLVEAFYNIFRSPKDQGLDEDQIASKSYFRMTTYLRTLPDKFWKIIVDHILSSVEMESTMINYLRSVRSLLRDVDVPDNTEKERIQKKAQTKVQNALKKKVKKKTQAKENLEKFISKDNKKDTDKKPRSDNIDIHLNINLVKKSQVYLSLPEDKQKEIETAILEPIPQYEEYKRLEKEKKDKKNSEDLKDVHEIRLVNKDGGNNYASCDGVYTRNTDVYINNERPYVNEERQRFIGRTGKGWTLTGKQWFDAIVEESKDKHHIFGGFHGSEGESEVVALSKWKEYEVIVCNGENYDYENYDYDKYVVGEISDEDEDEEEEEEEEEKQEEKEENKEEENQGMMLEVEEKDET